jgi:hypothetical protein
MTSLLLAALLAGSEADALGQHLFCLCGCAQTLASCPHPNCAEYDPARGVFGKRYLLEDIEGLSRENRSSEEILEAMAEKYGERVLTIPRARGLGVWAWIAPAAALVAGVAWVAWFLRREGREES